MIINGMFELWPLEQGAPSGAPSPAQVAARFAELQRTDPEQADKITRLLAIAGEPDESTERANEAI